MFDTPEIEFAISAVREAAHMARQIQREMVGEAISKEDRSPVTVGDFALQALIARRLAEQFPGTTLIGEEKADALRLVEGVSTLDQVTRFVQQAIPTATPEEVCGLVDRGAGKPSGTFWTLDPIDGTKGFLRREQYAVALAYIVEGEVEIGVLGCPELVDGARPEIGGPGSLIVAKRGQGTWTQALDGRQWRQLRVSTRSDPSEARILRSVEKAHTNTDEISQLSSRLGIATPTIALDSQAKYAVLGAGEGDALVRFLSPSRPDYREKIWDQAAGSLVVSEAGGRVTDLDGKALDFSHGRTLAKNRGILATNGHLHAAILEAIGAMGI